MDDDDALLEDGEVYADVLRDLAARLREAFMAQYTGDERMFALSLVSGAQNIVVTVRGETFSISAACVCEIRPSNRKFAV